MNWVNMPDRRPPDISRSITYHRTAGDVFREGYSGVNCLSEVTVGEWKILHKWNFNSHFKQQTHKEYSECNL